MIILAGSGAFSFNAASLTNTLQEKIKILYSTTGSEVADFTAFGGEMAFPTLYHTSSNGERSCFQKINF